MAVAEELGIEVDVVLYMKDPPDQVLLERITEGIDGPVEDLVRKDSQFKKLELDPDDYVGNADAVVELLARRKALLQRPVLVRATSPVVRSPHASDGRRTGSTSSSGADHDDPHRRPL